MRTSIIIMILLSLCSIEGKSQLMTQETNYSLRRTELKSQILSSDGMSQPMSFMARNPQGTSAGMLIVGGILLTVVPPLISDGSGAYIISGLGVTMAIAGLVVLASDLSN